MNYPAAELRSIKMNFYLINPDAEHRGILLIKNRNLCDFDWGIYVNLIVGAASSRDHAYYLGLSVMEGVEIVQILREKKIRHCFFEGEIQWNQPCMSRKNGAQYMAL